MTEENYEEQATEAEASAQQAPPAKQKNSEPAAAEEELEDTFHVNLDYD